MGFGFINIYQIQIFFNSLSNKVVVEAALVAIVEEAMTAPVEVVMLGMPPVDGAIKAVVIIATTLP